MKAYLKLVTPSAVLRIVAVKAPGRRPNAELRTREHLTGVEVDRLVEAAKDNRDPNEDRKALKPEGHGDKPTGSWSHHDAHVM